MRWQKNGRVLKKSNLKIAIELTILVGGVINCFGTLQSSSGGSGVREAFELLTSHFNEMATPELPVSLPGSSQKCIPGSFCANIFMTARSLEVAASMLSR